MRRIVVALLLGSSLAGCGQTTQSAECKKMIDCANALEAGSGDGAYAESYGAEGTCWLTFGAAEACTKTCKSVLEGLANRSDAPATCK